MWRIVWISAYLLTAQYFLLIYLQKLEIIFLMILITSVILTIVLSQVQIKIFVVASNEGCCDRFEQRMIDFILHRTQQVEQDYVTCAIVDKLDLFEFRYDECDYSYNIFITTLSMFDEKKAMELENKSHVRGKLAKQFYSTEQEELERKRREMRAILDQQVEEKKRQKEREKREHESKIRREEEKIKQYYSQLEERQNRNIVKPSNESYPVQHKEPSGFGKEHQSKEKMVALSHSNHSKEREIKGQGPKHQYIPIGDIPVMPVLQNNSPSKSPASHNNSGSSGGYQSSSRVHESGHGNYSFAGDIPLLELSHKEKNVIPNRKERKKIKSKASLRKEEMGIDEQPFTRKRRATLAEQESSHNPHQNSELKSVFGDLNLELQEQNKELKKQLKRNQQAMSLLFGAVRSNSKLDKFRVQAQKILYNGPVGDNNFGVNSRMKNPSTNAAEKERELILPKIKLKNKSIMHDYLLGSAKKHVLHALTLK